MDNSGNNTGSSSTSQSSSQQGSETNSSGKPFHYSAKNSSNKSGLFSSFSSFDSRKILGIAVMLVIIAAVPVTVFIAQKQQEVRQRAEAPPSCGNVKTDTVLIIDRSGSMAGDKIVKAKEAAKLFVDKVAQDPQNKVGLVSFSTNSSLDSSLTNDYSAVKSKIDGINAGGWTCTECGVKRANANIQENNNDGIKKVVILLTDGLANTILGSGFPFPTNPFPTYPFPSITFPPLPTNPFPSVTKVLKVLGESNSSAEQESNSVTQNGVRVSYGENGEITKQVLPSEAEQKAIDAVMEGKSANNTVFYTIGLGNDVNSVFLQKIADLTGGKYYNAPSADQLNTIYQEISQRIGKGSVGGFVFNDANGNGQIDTSEQKLAGWTVNLIDAVSSAIVKSFVTTDTGNFDITDVCDGSYKLSQEVKTGFAQTLPANPDYYSINTTNGSSYTDKNFGNRAAAGTITPTLTPNPSITATITPTGSGTSLNFTLDLQGINPGGGAANATPYRSSRNLKVQIFDTNNQKVAEKTGEVIYANDRYSSNFGKFIGSIFTNIQTGDYIIKVSTEGYLMRIIGKDTNQTVQHITSERDNSMPETKLLIGDINGDNSLDIKDYNIYLFCFGKVITTPIKDSNLTCENADLNDDHKTDTRTDLSDYRWLFENFQIQHGD